MVERVKIGFQGSTPVFRVSRPGRPVTSSNINDFIIHENFYAFRNYVKGSHAFTGSGSFDVPISGFVKWPFVLLRSSDYTLPNEANWFASCDTYVEFIRLHNVRNVARTIHYYIYQNAIGE